MPSMAKVELLSKTIAQQKCSKPCLNAMSGAFGAWLGGRVLLPPAALHGALALVEMQLVAAAVVLGAPAKGVV